MIAYEQRSAPPVAVSRRLHLDFVDGLRGLAALYVVLSHAALTLAQGAAPLPHWASLALRPLAFGHYAVAVFIVLSGYRLMFPVSLSSDKQLRGGGREYLARRCRRILPPYYAALVLSILTMPLVTLVKQQSGVDLTDADNLSLANIAAHLLLIHNFSGIYFQSIDGPLWSVATEFQIYFFLPFVLLPIWRRVGLVVTVASALLIGLGPHFLFPPGSVLSKTGFEGACPWYLSLFAFGMTAAVVCTSRDYKMQAFFENTPWGVLTLISLGLVGVGHFLVPHSSAAPTDASQWYIDILCGLFSTCLLILCSRRAQTGKFWLTEVLQSPPAMLLGAMSYSLYLVHVPLEQGTIWLLCSYHIALKVLVPATFLLVVPSIIGVCYLFHLIFERPFMPGKPRSQRAAEKAALLSPAP